MITPFFIITLTTCLLTFTLRALLKMYTMNSYVYRAEKLKGVVQYAIRTQNTGYVNEKEDTILVDVEDGTTQVLSELDERFHQLGKEVTVYKIGTDYQIHPAAFKRHCEPIYMKLLLYTSRIALIILGFGCIRGNFGIVIGFWGMASILKNLIVKAYDDEMERIIIKTVKETEIIDVLVEDRKFDKEHLEWHLKLGVEEGVQLPCCATNTFQGDVATVYKYKDNYSNTMYDFIGDNETTKAKVLSIIKPVPYIILVAAFLLWWEGII